MSQGVDLQRKSSNQVFTSQQGGSSQPRNSVFLVARLFRWKLAVYIALLSLLILAEAAALLLLFTDNQWRQRLPGGRA